MNESAIIEFLRQSNYIEGVYDEESLSQAVTAWNFLEDQKVLSIPVMLKTHKILMLNQTLKPNEKGYLRKIPVFIGRHEAMNWKIIPTHLADLSYKMTHYPKLWKEHHIEYEKIHPFVDGNGRTGRMFMNWQRLKAGLPIEIIYEADKQDYYKWFK